MPPKLKELFEKTYHGDYVKVQLKNGRIKECMVDFPTYVNASDDDDTDVPAVHVVYKNGTTELLIEDDIEKVLD